MSSKYYHKLRKECLCNYVSFINDINKTDYMSPNGRIGGE
jgi:hypothetical protein